MSVTRHLRLFSILLIIHSINAQETNEAVQFIDHPNKNEYLLHQPGTDKHKYGYELKDNKHFHHTTTEDDGVRLGCYGYVLEGKKYSTQYVADVKGYRPVYTYDIIPVYPKSGGMREATFVGNFREDDKKSSNIRYFFPEGCRGGNMLTVEQNPMIPPVPLTPRPPPPPPTPTTPRVTPPAPPTPPPSTPKPPPPPPPTPSTRIVPPPPKRPTPPPPPPPSKPPSTYLPPIASTYLPPVTGSYVTKAIPTTPKPKTPATRVQETTRKITTPKPPPPTRPPPPPPVTTPRAPPPTTPKVVKNTCNNCCSAESESAKITIPIKLPSDGKTGSCPVYAKLIVPASVVSSDKLKALLNNPTELGRDILRSLS